MEQQLSFSYSYSAKRCREIEEIRQRYLPKDESKIEELLRLDKTVQSAGVAQSLCFGIGGTLVLGLGLCLAMQVIGHGVLLAILGVLLGIVGIMGMLVSHVVYLRIHTRKKTELAPRILELAAELAGDEEQI